MNAFNKFQRFLFLQLLLVHDHLLHRHYVLVDLHLSASIADHLLELLIVVVEKAKVILNLLVDVLVLLVEEMLFLEFVEHLTAHEKVCKLLLLSRGLFKLVEQLSIAL